MKLELIDNGMIIDGKQDKPLKEKTTYKILESILDMPRLLISKKLRDNNGMMETGRFTIYRTYEEKDFNFKPKYKYSIKKDSKIISGTLEELLKIIGCTKSSIIDGVGRKVKGWQVIRENKVDISYLTDGEEEHRDLTYVDACKLAGIVHMKHHKHKESGFINGYYFSKNKDACIDHAIKESAYYATDGERYYFGSLKRLIKETEVNISFSYLCNLLNVGAFYQERNIKIQKGLK